MTVLNNKFDITAPNLVRNQFACAALTGILSCSATRQDVYFVAQAAFEYADAMMEEAYIKVKEVPKDDTE